MDKAKTNRALKQHWKCTFSVWLCALALLLGGLMPCAAVCAQDLTVPELAARQASEYKIKAVYLYKFLMFVDWPKASKDKNEIVIGIVGKDPFGSSFNKVDGKVIKARGKRLRIKRFGQYKKELKLSECDLLFIASSEKKNMSKIVALLKSRPVLTVADSKGFLEGGGMINLVKSGSKVKWEVNRTPMLWAKLRPHSQFLRIALRVVEIPKIDKKN
jgi:hypothetical protein